MTDKVITEGVAELLKRLSKRLPILYEKYTDILENYADYPIHTPHNDDQHIERLYELCR